MKMENTNNKNVFEIIAKSYIREDSHWGSDFDLIKITIEELLKRKSTIKYADIGCGTGFHVASIGEWYPEIDIIGIDYSSRMLEQARLRVKKLNVQNVHFKEKDIIEDPLDESYDLITFLNNGFGNLYREGDKPEEIRKKVIKKIANSLNDEGYLLLSVYNKEKLDPNYGSNLRLLEKLSNLDHGDLFVEYTTKNGNKVVYYSRWFFEKEMYELTESNLELDFLERRMSRFLARYKKVGEKNES